MDNREKEELLIWLDDLKIKSDSQEYFVWYDQAVQDVMDAIHQGRFDQKGKVKPIG